MKLIHGDCIAEMDKMIADGVKVDMILTSPPYDKLRTYDKTLDWNFDIFKQVADRLSLVIKDGGIIVWVVADGVDKKGSETGTSFRQALYFKDVCGLNIHDTMIYKKLSCLMYPINRYYQSFEYMFVFSKGKPKTHNLLRQPTKYSLNEIEKAKQGLFYIKKPRFKKGVDKTLITKQYKSHNETRIRDNVWQFATGNVIKDKTGFGHPAVFPEKLAEEHILSWSNEQDLILDPFMGSNTTGKICKKLNRNFIGIEKVKEYYDLSVKRVGG